MAVLNQDSNTKLQALTALETDAITGGLTTRETIGGTYVNLVDHSGIYSCYESAKTAADALCDADNSWYSNGVQNLMPVELSDGNWGLMKKTSGTYATKSDADNAGRALEKLTDSH